MAQPPPGDMLDSLAHHAPARQAIALVVSPLVVNFFLSSLWGVLGGGTAAGQAAGQRPGDSGELRGCAPSGAAGRARRDPRADAVSSARMCRGMMIATAETGTAKLGQGAMFLSKGGLPDYNTVFS